MDNNSDKIYDVIILGAGISGLGMAHNLLKEKKSSFAILERNEGVGGTWREILIQVYVVMFLHIFILSHLR